MAFSLVRSLTAPLRRNIQSLKRESKRLHKASRRIFGMEFPLTTCQEAVAAAHGIESWRSVNKLAARVGLDRSLPFWHLDARNDHHQNILEAIIKLEVSSIKSAPIVFRGDIDTALEMATCSWLEEMSARRCPGLIMVETNAEAFQDTPLWGVVAKLGCEELFDQFRIIDARETSLPMKLADHHVEWMGALLSGLSRDAYEAVRPMDFERLLWCLLDKDQRTFSDGIAAIWRALESPEEHQGPSADQLKTFVDQCPPSVLREIIDLVSSVSMKHSDSQSEVLADEMQFRPAIVLFSRTNPSSVTVAGLMYGTARWLLSPIDMLHSPILYFAHGSPGYWHPIFEVAGGTFIVDGLQSKAERAPDIRDIHGEVTMQRARFVTTTADSVTYSGKRAKV